MSETLVKEKEAVQLSSTQQILLETIMKTDFSREKQYLVNRWKKDEHHVDLMEVEFKRFMFLRAIYPEQRLPISKGVDDFWHAAVLSTRRYEDFCLNTLGGFVHHNPTVDETENWVLMPDYLKNTLKLYEFHFGVAPKIFWSRDYTNGSCCIC